MNVQVYFRHDQNTRGEYEICKKYFDTVDCRTKLKNDNGIVICRYSALPFNRELENDLNNLGCRPINSNIEHSYIADMGWVYDLESMTFPTWERLQDVPSDFPLVVKGKTNSRKFEWDTKMFAPNKAKAAEIMHELWHDPLIGTQGLVFRKYIPLKTYEIGINGMPMTNEWRCFFYKDKLIDYGFYWSILEDMSLVETETFEKEGLSLAKEAAKIIGEFTNYFVIDIAQGVDGRWWVVEVNDGQMSGLSTIPEDRFYMNLAEVLK
jgi:hypothetical protein